MKKVKKILLVDDSTATNFFNKTMVQKTDLVEEVVLAKNGKEALDCLYDTTIPDIIFLDINMPVMNGWEFLTEFEKLDIRFKKSTIILMIGAELAPEDMERVKRIPQIKECRGKTLNKEIVTEIVNKYFENVNSVEYTN
ncbi:response regulator [Aquimarina pacifica]|uniref:response regulator n=1 Tax=Aquimarina pacifica TaxID=1296415 RepID=UPI00046F167E|nr:response regulator [Aquimarina pacifica]